MASAPPALFAEKMLLLTTTLPNEFEIAPVAPGVRIGMVADKRAAPCRQRSMPAADAAAKIATSVVLFNRVLPC